MNKCTRKVKLASKKQPYAEGKRLSRGMPGDEKFPIWELCIARVSEWENDKSCNQSSTQKFVDSVELTRLQSLVLAVLKQAREAVMLFGSSFRHYHLIRGPITAVAWMGVCHVSCHKPYSSIDPSTINNEKHLHIKDNYML